MANQKLHTNCCNGRSLVEDVFGAHVLDGLGIDGLMKTKKEKLTVRN